MREPVRHLGADIGENHYRAAHEAAEAIVSGVYEMIPVDVHDLVHEAALAGYATALSDLEEGKLDDRVRARLEEVVPTRSLNEGAG
ncbi:hypothetical protein YUMDRAFT_00769 [Streptomyces sp. OspMP-M45]|nr:hypothetical protein YUMDRAFT_00769 [Streptomyces sp. OspMP-M45]